MAYPRNFYRLVVEGAGYGRERWSWGLSMATEVTIFLTGPPPEVPPSIVQAVTTFHSTSALFSAAAALDTIKFNLIGTDGRYQTASESIREELQPPVPGGGTGFPPAQLAVAVTLTTARSRGRGSRGRFYPPYPVFVSNVAPTTGGLQNPAVQPLADAASALVNALNSATDPNDATIADLRVVVASDIGTGLLEPVTAVSVGRIVDTMRSRRTSLDEDRLSGPAIAGAT